MRSLRMKMVMIMVILILALMLTTGAFLMSGVGNFYVSQFYEQMEGTFTPEFIAQLQRLSAEDNAPAQMKELLMAQAGLGIDITGRNVYILDQTGSVLDSSNQRTTVVMTQNILSAMNGEVGQSSSVTNDYMDLAVPVESDGAQYIAYIRDNRATVDALTSELLIIILRALALGLVICVILSFLLSQSLITPIRALTVTAIHLSSDGEAYEQANLFDPTAGQRNARQEKLESAMDAIRKKYGGDAIVYGAARPEKEEDPLP